ncbi:DUF5958 family protein [Marinibactrum halimedae]|uniref:Uncharacterized protein n=1 Tax=Marinibactrum halimedae TaxID=1444977 RepID=A0AA37T6Q2_9GAMM|nr:DUF5958 family protein [Marinibactrum halimedae]MCD9461285.1 DUF5958 family protein [Marinibactrum halimedae]GLS25727.1 hypothetical protein GCM10007877_14410 [Marinibactrum halimedae]
MDIKTDIYLNQISQGVKPLNEAVEWFISAKEIQIEVLRRLIYFILQSGALGKDVESAISNSGLKPTFTPCQLLLKVFREEPNGNIMLSQSLSNIANLPESEREKSFKLLLAMFSIADKRKREKGLQPEKYWWHKDLSDVGVVEKILANG